MHVEEYASPANRKHKPHIFPKALLSRIHVSVGRANSVVNLCFICGEENSQFGSKKRFKYLGEFQRKRYFARVMRTHLIPFDPKRSVGHNCHSRLWLFLENKNAFVVPTFERVAGMKLFRERNMKASLWFKSM